MNVVYHLIGIAMVIILIARLEGEIGRPEQPAPETVAVHGPIASATPPGSAPLNHDGAAPLDTAVARATFMGHPCPQSDCAGNLAGYRWAEEKGISDPGGCQVLSAEFADGCRLFARMEQQYNI